MWNDVVENTKLVFIDDVLINFNFELLFPNLTGDWTVNYKGGRRITLPFETSPKIYIATNHAIRCEGSSFTDRQWLLGFSDFYNDTHKPIDDFGCNFLKNGTSNNGTYVGISLQIVYSYIFNTASYKHLRSV